MGRWRRTRYGSCCARASECRRPANSIEETPTMERQGRRPGGPVVWIVAAGLAGLLACSAPASAPPAGGGAASAPPAPAAAGTANATPAAASPTATPAQLRQFDLGA